MRLSEETSTDEVVAAIWSRWTTAIRLAEPAVFLCEWQ
jgi:hypothetical protein